MKIHSQNHATGGKEFVLGWDAARVVMLMNRLNYRLPASSYPTSTSPSLFVRMWWAKKLKKQLSVWNVILLQGFEPFCWICILTTFLSNWKSGVRTQSLDLWYGNYLPFMSVTFRKSWDPAAAAVFEGKSIMTCICLPLFWSLQNTFSSLIIRSSKVV